MMQLTLPATPAWIGVAILAVILAGGAVWASSAWIVLLSIRRELRDNAEDHRRYDGYGSRLDKLETHERAFAAARLQARMEGR